MHKWLRHILCTLGGGALLFLCSCSNSVQAWDRSDLVGHCYDLRHRKKGQTFTFIDSGDVVATFSDKKEGWATGPILGWELTTNGVLLIKDHEQKTMMTFFKIARDAKTVTVRNASGRKEVWLETNAKHNAIQNALAMISTLEAVALLALPVATILYYRRLRRIRTSWPWGICLVVGFLAALGLILILTFLLATIWPNLHEIQF